MPVSVCLFVSVYLLLYVSMSVFVSLPVSVCFLVSMCLLWYISICTYLLSLRFLCILVYSHTLLICEEILKARISVLGMKLKHMDLELLVCSQPLHAFC